MIKLVWVFAAMLALLGLGFYVGTGMESATALIPLLPAVLLAICAALAAARPDWHKHAMHAAMVVALLGVLASGMGWVQLARWVGGTPPDRPAAVAEAAAMGLICLLLLILGVRSFIAARRAPSDQPSG